MMREAGEGSGFSKQSEQDLVQIKLPLHRIKDKKPRNYIEKGNNSKVMDSQAPGMHAPPRPAPAPGEMAAPGCPGPENFQLCPAPKIVPGQGPRQTFLHHHKVLGIKNF